MSPSNPTEIRLSDDVRDALGRTSADMHRAMTHTTKALLSLNAVFSRTSTPLFAGIDPAEKRRRRAVGKRQRAARRITRQAA